MFDKEWRVQRRQWNEMMRVQAYLGDRPSPIRRFLEPTRTFLWYATLAKANFSGARTSSGVMAAGRPPWETRRADRF
jgi:hypothetical protein